MNSAVSSFFSRDVFLRRQARTTRKRPTRPNVCLPSSAPQDALPMIEEEDEARASTSRSPSPGEYFPTATGAHIKSKRRHANLSESDIQMAKTALIPSASDISLQNSNLLSWPTNAPSPQVSSTLTKPSLEFLDNLLKCPDRPILDQYRTCSDSPTPSISSCSSSASTETQSSSLPATPSSSDDEFISCLRSPSPSLKPRCAPIKPLAIIKHNRPVSVVSTTPSLSTSLSRVIDAYSLPSPLSSWEEDSDSESDFEWYSREFSKTLTLDSAVPPPFVKESRPDSMCLENNPLPATPSTPSKGFPSLQLDPSFPRRRLSRLNTPNYPPVVPSPHCNFLTTVPLSPTRRPPPRSSIPADCILVDDTLNFADDEASTFSFSLYDTSPTKPSQSDCPQSACSRQSFPSPRPSPFPSSFPSTPSPSFPTSIDEEFDFEDIEFDVEIYQHMMLPLDLPTSPLDLEADLASRFEQLRNEPHPQFQDFGARNCDVFNNGTDTFEPRCPGTGDQSPVLRSRWSSSTLGSVREEHARRPGLGLALRTYFSSSNTKPGARRNPSTRRVTTPNNAPK